MSRIFLAGYVGPGTVMDRAIRLTSNSRFSHTELVRAARIPRPGEQHPCLSASLRDRGVRERRIAFDPGKWEFLEVPWAPPDAWDRASAHLGLPYDLVGVFLSHVAPLARHDPAAWFCSELCGEGLGLDQPHRYAPGGLMRMVAERNAQWWGLPAPKGPF